MKIPALVMYYFVRVRVVSQIFELGRDQNAEINNTGFGVNRYRCVHTQVLNLVLEVRQY